MGEKVLTIGAEKISILVLFSVREFGENVEVYYRGILYF